MKQVVIIRGLPGSGKTTLATALAEQVHTVHVEADHFFERIGKVFDRALLAEAHADCFTRFELALYDPRVQRVIVSNTFTTRWEYQPYVDAANKAGYSPQIVVCRGNFGSVHDVPEAALRRMRERWED